MLSTADLIARAEAVLATGFASESARKEILIYSINRAYEQGVQRAIMDKLLSNGADRTAQSWRDLYYGVPDLHVWKSKHDAQYAAFPEEVALANRLVALRNAVKAAALVAKAPSKKAVKEAARIAVAKTCQICGRPILAETGLIAHHGYRRPGDGFQTASCYGARELPFEVSRDCLGRYLSTIRKQLANMQEARAKAEGELIPIRLSYATYEGGTYRRPSRDVHFEMTRATFENAKAEHPKFFEIADRSRRPFDAFLAADLAERAQAIRYLVAYITFQQARYDAWRAI